MRKKNPQMELHGSSAIPINYDEKDSDYYVYQFSESHYKLNNYFFAYMGNIVSVSY